MTNGNDKPQFNLNTIVLILSAMSLGGGMWMGFNNVVTQVEVQAVQLRALQSRVETSDSVADAKVAGIEHYRAPYDPDDPDATEPKAGDPPSYTALRMRSSMYVEYDTGEVGYYDLNADPYELRNIASSLTPARLAELHAAALANSTCAGVAQCGAAQDLR